MVGHGRPVALPAAVRLVAQQRFQVTGAGQLTQRLAQQVNLTGKRGVVEVEVDGLGGKRALVDTVAGRQGLVSNEGSAAVFAAHQTHRFEFGVDARGGDDGDALPLGQAAVSGQLRAGSQPTGTNLGRESVDETFVSRGGHP